MTRIRTSHFVFSLLFMLALLVLAVSTAGAEQAEDIASACTLKTMENYKTRKYVLTPDLTQRWQAGRTGET